MIRSIWKNRSLIRRLVVREVERKFKGTVFGFVWTVIGPLLMLGTYSFAFGTVFGARWVTVDDPYGIPYPLAIFSGMMMAGVLMELLVRSPSLVLENVAYVKKVVFPLEIIPVVALGSALFNTVATFLVFLVGYIYALGLPPITIFLIPIVIIPLLLLTLGFSYLLASFGVFLRDISQIVPAISTAILLTSTTFFQLEQLPEEWQTIVLFNPLTIPIMGLRDLVFYSKLPDMGYWLAYFSASILIFALGAFWFEKTKKAFADVL